MFDLIKWFWANMDFRGWKFEGRKLNNPLIIIIRLLMIIPIKMAGVILALCYLIAFDTHNAEMAFREHVFYY